MTTNVIPITDFRKEAKDVLNKIKESPIVLTQRSRPVAVVIEYEAYREKEKHMEDLELLLDDYLLSRAIESAKEFVTMEELFAE
jgi:prevent-host-death family protein